MITKLKAARLATAGGTEVVLASGNEPEVIVRLAHGEHVGTLFPATGGPLESRKRWILSGLAVRGSIVVDDGAARALRERNTSLLPAGVREVCGEFARGDTVADRRRRRPSGCLRHHQLRLRGCAGDPRPAICAHRGDAGARLRDRGRASRQSGAGVAEMQNFLTAAVPVNPRWFSTDAPPPVETGSDASVGAAS